MRELNVTQQDLQKAERIRRRYLSREENKMEQLKKLDDKVKAPGLAAAGIMGVAGSLTMGAGMSMVMVWSNMTTGLVLGIPGLLVTALAWPVYRAITGKRQKQYADEIMRISDSLILNKEEEAQ